MLELTVCLDAEAEVPLYQQLYEHLAGQIRCGMLKKGDRLPGSGIWPGRRRWR